MAQYLCFFVYILSSGDKQQNPKKLKSQDVESMVNIVSEEQKLRDRSKVEFRNKLSGNAIEKQAQMNYLKGFRDYQQGNYKRSLPFFNSCLSLVPNHPLCIRYHILAKRKFNEMVEYNVKLGNQYRRQNQLKECHQAFKTVVNMIDDKNDVIYKDAKKQMNICGAELGGKY